MRRPHPGEGANTPEARYQPEGAGVDAPGLWHEGHASYPVRPADLPLETDVLPASQGVGMGRQESADAVSVRWAAHEPGGFGYSAPPAASSVISQRVFP